MTEAVDGGSPHAGEHSLPEDEEIDYAELMAEPPGGGNFGREKIAPGWRDLATGEIYARSPALKASAPRHGLVYTYVKRRCRCVLCRQAKARYERQRRGNV